MSREKTGKERFNELRYQMEKNSFVLNVLESRTAAVLHAESMGYDDTETAMICRINAEYVKLIRAVKDQHPGSIECIAQELFDRIYMQSGWKRDYSRFRLFDEELIERWFVLKEQERQLRAGNIDLDDFIATAKHAYWSKTGKDVDIIVKEIEEKPEPEQQETEPEESDEDDSREMISHLNRQVAQDEIICRMFREGAIPEDVAIKYVGGDLEHNSFMKLVWLYADEGKEPEAEPETEETSFDFFEYHKKETEAKLICRMYREGIIDEAVALEYLDEPDWSHDTLMRVVDMFEEKEKEEE